ncbi:MAG: hypothetical protein J7K30_09410 [Deltaproteobacteria bacterium]|nr:hypothetical protein [Deltaproteobacteria bacterium]
MSKQKFDISPFLLEASKQKKNTIEAFTKKPLQHHPNGIPTVSQRYSNIITTIFQRYSNGIKKPNGIPTPFQWYSNTIREKQYYRQNNLFYIIF